MRIPAGAPWVRRTLFGLAVFQVVSTLIGLVTLVFMGDLYTEALAHTAFAGQFVVAGLFLGVVVGGFHWFALWVHLRQPAWLGAAHALAGVSMVGWIFGECLILNAFNWAHLLWGSAGLLQLAAAFVHVGGLTPQTLADTSAHDNRDV